MSKETEVELKLVEELKAAGWTRIDNRHWLDPLRNESCDKWEALRIKRQREGIASVPAK